MPKLPSKKEQKEVQDEQNTLVVDETTSVVRKAESAVKAIDVSIAISKTPTENVVSDGNDPALYDREYKRQGRMPVAGRKEPVK